MSTDKGTGVVDLHSIEKTPFLDWDEESTYLEAVSVPLQSEAEDFLADEMCVPLGDLDVRKVHMRWVENGDKEAWTAPDGTEYREGWLECKDGEPGAVPFWKDQV